MLEPGNTLGLIITVYFGMKENTRVFGVASYGGECGESTFLRGVWRLRCALSFHREHLGTPCDAYQRGGGSFDGRIQAR